ncbi:MAG: hypothetical protein DSY80_06530 [Desulfocapsa sp.]|nr:MAG: hypothetical protein DSY80_06530 [Desulfocapsa sp.]
MSGQRLLHSLKNQNNFMKVSLKRLGVLSFSSVAILLIFVIFFGIRQYQLNERYDNIITQSEEMIFEFSTVREQISTALIGRQWHQIGAAAAELKIINTSLRKIQENTLIPSEYRLDLAKNADIGGIAILAKELSLSGHQLEKSLQLQNKMRKLSEYLIRFDRIIVSQMRAKVIQFQTVMIGSLAIIICLISFSLTLFYKKTMLPLLRLQQQIKGTDPDKNLILYTDPASCSELESFAASVNELLQHTHNSKNSAEISPDLDEKLGKLLNESTNLANGIINYAQLLTDSYREVEMGNEETKILQSIMDDAERIAKLNKIENLQM